ncbi:hypothetical protein Hanom_Chr00s104313g01805141 [Helianthus anomalus]
MLLILRKLIHAKNERYGISFEHNLSSIFQTYQLLFFEHIRSGSFDIQQLDLSKLFMLILRLTTKLIFRIYLGVKVTLRSC